VTRELVGLFGPDASAEEIASTILAAIEAAEARQSREQPRPFALRAESDGASRQEVADEETAG